MAPNAKADAVAETVDTSTVVDKTMTEEEKNIAMIQGALAAWGKHKSTDVPNFHLRYLLSIVCCSNWPFLILITLLHQHCL